MTKFKTLMMSTILASGMIGAVALPASALTLGADAGLSVDVGASVGNAGVKADGAVKGNAAANASETAKANANENSAVAAAAEDPMIGMESSTDSAFLGNVVVTSDGKEIGTIDKVWLDAEGGSHVQVKLKDMSGKDYDRFTIAVQPDLKADGTLQLGWTEAELMAALEAEVKAKAQSNG